ncbi:organic hydroperoxide resistance protein [Streptomyces sp. MAR4 CNY-716]
MDAVSAPRNDLYTASVTATGGRDGCVVSSDGELEVKLALPPALGGDGRGTNPEQLFAAGYATCFANALTMVARAARQRLERVEVTGEVGLGRDADGGFSLSVTLRVDLPDELRNETGHDLVRQAHGACPYSKATRGNIPVRLLLV